MTKRGIIIAFVGCDGSGKSTVARNIFEWLSWKNDVELLYMGSGDGEVGLFTSLKQRLNTFFRRKRAHSGFFIKSIKKENKLRKTINYLISTFFNFALALERQRKVQNASKCMANGKIVLTDRYPQNEFETIFDGPQIAMRDDIHSKINFLITFLKNAEKKIYNKFKESSPDLVIKLHVPFEVSRIRKPDENAINIKRKIDITKNIQYNGAKIINIDASQPLEKVIKSVKAAVWSNL